MRITPTQIKKNLFSGVLIGLLAMLGACGSPQMPTAPYEVQGNETTSAAPQATQPPTATRAPLAAGGRVAYQFNDRLYLIEALENATPLDVSAALDTFDPGKDEWLNLSPDGNWLLISAERLDSRCKGWACLHIAPADLSRLEVVLVNDEPLHPDYSVAASGGNLLILTQDGGPHARDLWATKRQSDGWSQPILLTAASPYDYNILPSISDDGARLVFTCSPDPYGQEGSAICEVDTDGNSFRVVLTPDNGPGGSASNSLREPTYAPDGSIVFEADWGGERIWRLLPGSSQPNLVNAEMGNDNSPCVLPNSSIASLWLARPGSSGVHELKVMSADGSSYFMIISGQDISDTGISCGQ